MNYQLITQIPYCCAATSLIMILERRRLPHGNQQEISRELGLILPHEGPMPEAGYGTQIQKDKYSIEKYFDTHSIPLYCSHYFIIDLKEAEQCIKKNLKENNDIMVCFSNRLLGDQEGGHIGLIESMDKKSITLISPETDQTKRVKVDLDKLLDSVNKHSKKNGSGFWIISEHQ